MRPSPRISSDAREGVHVREIRTTVDIDASREEVWSVLADFASYPGWNPFIILTGRAQTRTRVRLKTMPPGRPANTQTADVLMAWAPRHLRIQGTLIAPWLFSGTHIFELTELEGGTRLTNREEFSGVLAPVVVTLLGPGLPGGFEAMNRALKARVEARVARA
jgi:hypothetical protein